MNYRINIDFTLKLKWSVPSGSKYDSNNTNEL